MQQLDLAGRVSGREDARKDLVVFVPGITDDKQDKDKDAGGGVLKHNQVWQRCAHAGQQADGNCRNHNVDTLSVKHHHVSFKGNIQGPSLCPSLKCDQRKRNQKGHACFAGGGGEEISRQIERLFSHVVLSRYYFVNHSIYTIDY